MRGGSPIRRLAVLLLALALSAWSPGVRAEPTEAELARNEQAVTLGERGLAAFRAEQWEPAYGAFRAAESLVHSPVFVLYMARSRARQGNTAEALDLYVRVENEPLTADAPEAWRVAVAQAKSEASELRRVSEAAESPRLPTLPSQKATRPASAQRTTRRFAPSPAAITAGAIGVAGLALGAAAGLMARHRLTELKERCGGTACDESEGEELDAVKDWGRLADVGFVVAAAGLGTGAVLIWLVPGPSVDSAPSALSVTTRVSF
jgi:hypothetical protein